MGAFWVRETVKNDENRVKLCSNRHKNEQFLYNFDNFIKSLLLRKRHFLFKVRQKVSLFLFLGTSGDKCEQNMYNGFGTCLGTPLFLPSFPKIGKNNSKVNTNPMPFQHIMMKTEVIICHEY